MAHEATLILLMTSEIGHMMKDPTYCPPSADQADIMGFFNSLITEQEASYTLKHSNLPQMQKDIASYFDDVSSDKNKLIAEEAAEAAADVVAAAATIAAAAGSWVPFVNFGLAAAAIAATATALGLEIASEDLQKTVVEEISAADSHIISKYSSFDNVKIYSEAVNVNNLFYPRFQLAATVKQMRALFLGVIVVVKKQNKGKCTAEDVKKIFLDYYDATQASPELVGEYEQILQALDETNDTDKFKNDMEVLVAKMPAIVVRSYTSIMLAFAVAIAIRKGKAAYSVYTAARDAMPPDIELSELDAEGNAVEESGAPAAEAEVMSTAEIGIRAMGVLAGVATLVFAALEIVKAVDTDKKLTKAIADAKEGITDYYTALVKSSIDGVDGGEVAASVVGKYECHKYDNGGKNNWHYVTVTKVDASTLKWTNRAGVSWLLQLTLSKSILDIGPDCPYYHFDNGKMRTSYTQAAVVWDGNSVTGLMGPWGELYSKST